jgi:hypothetical protein
MGSQLAALTEQMQNVQSFSAAAQPIDSALTVSLPLANKEALDEFEKRLTDDGSLLPAVVGCISLLSLNQNRHTD